MSQFSVPGMRNVRVRTHVCVCICTNLRFRCVETLSRTDCVMAGAFTEFEDLECAPACSPIVKFLPCICRPRRKSSQGRTLLEHYCSRFTKNTMYCIPVHGTEWFSVYTLSHIHPPALWNNSQPTRPSEFCPVAEQSKIDSPTLHYLPPTGKTMCNHAWPLVLQRLAFRVSIHAHCTMVTQPLLGDPTSVPARNRVDCGSAGPAKGLWTAESTLEVQFRSSGYFR